MPLPLDNLPLDREQMKITLLKPYGQRSWLVKFKGLYDVKAEEMHVELRTADEVKTGYFSRK